MTDTVARALRDRLMALLGPSHPHDEGRECGACAAYNLLTALRPVVDITAPAATAEEDWPTQFIVSRGEYERLVKFERDTLRAAAVAGEET